MNENFAINLKGFQEFSLDMEANNEFSVASRLPIIVIQTPAEVEAGLYDYWSSDNALSLKQTNQEASRSKEDNNGQTIELIQNQRLLDACKMAGTTNFGNEQLSFHNCSTFQFSSENKTDVEFSCEVERKRPTRKSRLSSRSKTKKGHINEVRSPVGDALLAFKKMKLNNEEDESME